MIIYHDSISGDELFSDTFKVTVLHNVVLEVKGKQVTYKEGVDESLLGANPSEEGGGEALEEGMVSGVDIVIANRLVETAISKKEYQKHIKKYMGAIKKKLDDKGDDAIVKLFIEGAQKFVKEMLGEFDEYQFFLAESMPAEGMLVLMKWKGEIPYLYFFKHGLDAEKV